LLRTANETIGAAWGSNLSMIGSMISRGSVLRMAATFSRTSVAATCGFLSRTKMAAMIETPSDDVEVT
jgi:hypothetical protein